MLKNIIKIIKVLVVCFTIVVNSCVYAGKDEGGKMAEEATKPSLNLRLSLTLI